MEKSIIQRLQQVRAKDLFHILLFLLAVLPACILGKKRHIWLISETPDEARDNGYWLFRYIRENHKNIDAVYAINKHSPDFKTVAGLGSTVQFGSFKHWIYYLACDVKISSQKSGRPDDAVCYLLDRIGIHKKEVFLQHGVIKDDLPYIHADKAKFSLFTTSTEKEYQYVRENFGFHSEIVKTGLCRFDDLHNAKTNMGLILVIPTWRQWIAMPDLKSKQAEQFGKFRDTEYFQTWNQILHSEQFTELLHTYHMDAVFYPHRHMQKFAGEFTQNLDGRIRVATFPECDVHELLKSGAVLITDYSSVAMDFAYMAKPVIYFQFDQERFRNYHLPEGYFDYHTDGFGPVAEDIGSVLAALEHCIKNKCNMPAEYRQRADEFFDLKDTENCKRTYNAIIRLLGNESQ